jgi:hypothetical protein
LASAVVLDPTDYQALLTHFNVYSSNAQLMNDYSSFLAYLYGASNDNALLFKLSQSVQYWVHNNGSAY